MLGQEKAVVSNGRLATFKNSTATTTSNFVKQAETIGLMPLGQTNAPEFGFKILRTLRFTGQPAILGTWNIRQASGGAAAVVASGLFL